MRFSMNENCISKSTEYLSNLLQRDVKIEQAHRDGRAPSGKDRHIYVPFIRTNATFLKLQRHRLEEVIHSP